jgi:hypothetical protein
MSCLILAATLMVGLQKEKEAIEIGTAVLAVDKLLDYQFPDTPTEADKESLEKMRNATVRAGQSSPSMYKWVRSRIQFEMDSELSFIRDTRPDKKSEKKIRDRVEFLARVIHEIDAPK